MVIPVQNPRSEEVEGLELDTRSGILGAAEAVVEELQLVRLAKVRIGPSDVTKVVTEAVVDASPTTLLAAATSSSTYC